MTKYRNALPQLKGDQLFLTDGGLETDLIFNHGIDLPLFASISLFKDDDNPAVFADYFTPYLETARAQGRGFVLESATWRASPGWIAQLGYAPKDFETLNRKAIASLVKLRNKFDSPETPVLISGNIGPRGDGYAIDEKMTAEEAEAYHAAQINLFADTEADLVTTLTMTYVEEAIGIARAAKAAGMPVVVSFTVETDGRLPSGQALGEAIEEVDAATDGYPAYFMINCAHPDHFMPTLKEGGDWTRRIRGLRANASRMSHEELDNAEELDDGTPQELGHQYAELRREFPVLVVLGGCCGTDHRHVHEIAKACA
jgi:S-methylmethionine-dependent homocysteine/selenocysteine methylase